VKVFSVRIGSLKRSQDISINIVTRLRAGRPRFDSR